MFAKYCVYYFQFEHNDVHLVNRYFLLYPSFGLHDIKDLYFIGGHRQTFILSFMLKLQTAELYNLCADV